MKSERNSFRKEITNIWGIYSNKNKTHKDKGYQREESHSTTIK